MEARNTDLIKNKAGIEGNTKFTDLDRHKLNMEHMKYAQGLGASLRFANELHAVKQVGRLPFLKSSNLHEDVLKGKLGPNCGFDEVFPKDEEQGKSRLSFL